MNNPTKSQIYSIGIEGRTLISSPGSNMPEDLVIRIPPGKHSQLLRNKKEIPNCFRISL